MYYYLYKSKVLIMGLDVAKWNRYNNLKQNSVGGCRDGIFPVLYSKFCDMPTSSLLRKYACLSGHKMF